MTQAVHLPAGGPRTQFASRLGFLLATAGSAIGLGNIWRFPYIAGQHGGGAFLLPYLLALGAIGIPMIVIELAAGRASGKGVVGAFTEAGRKYRWVGIAIAIASLLLVANYLVVTGWAVGYFVIGLADQHPSFADFTSGPNSLIFFIGALLFTAVIVRLGVNKGIEASSKILLPVLVVLLLGLAGYAMTLHGLGDALDFRLGGAIKVSENRGGFDKCPACLHLFEALLVNKVVIDAILLVRALWAGCMRNTHRRMWHRLDQCRDKAGLASA